MDVGVGSVVFSSGIVAARPYVNQSAPTGLYALLGSVRSALPVLLLGFLRLVLTKGVNYQVNSLWVLYDRIIHPSVGTPFRIRSPLEFLLHTRLSPSFCNAG